MWAGMGPRTRRWVPPEATSPRLDTLRRRSFAAAMARPAGREPGEAKRDLGC